MKVAELAKRLARISADGGPDWKKDSFLKALRAAKPSDFAVADRHGSTVMHYLADVGAANAMLYLWENGHLVEANLEAVDNEGHTPLERGRAGQPGRLPARCLLEIFGVNYHRFDADGTTIADRATDQGKNAAGDYLKNLAKTRLRGKLFEAPPALGLRDLEGRTALHYAVLERDWDTAEGLVSRGADWNAPDANGESPLWYVLRGGDEQGYAFYKKRWVQADTGEPLFGDPAPRGRIQRQRRHDP